MKLILIITMLLNTLINAEVINVKYWKLPDISYNDSVLNKKDMSFYKKWIRSDSPEIVILNNVTNKHVIDIVGTFFKPICATPSDNQKSQMCIYLAPTVSSDIKIKIFNSTDTNHVAGQFEISPIMFQINKEIGIIVIDTQKGTNKKPYKYIEYLKDYFIKKSGLKNENIFIIGSFNAQEDELMKHLDKSKHIVKFKTGSTIIKNQKYELMSTENIITHVNSKFLKYENIQYNVFQLDSKYSTKNKQENMKLFSENVSEYLPITFKIDYDFILTTKH